MTKWQLEKAKREWYKFIVYERTRKEILFNPDKAFPLELLSFFLHGTSKRHNFMIRNVLFYCLRQENYTLPEFISTIREKKECFLSYRKFSVYAWEYLDDLLESII